MLLLLCLTAGVISLRAEIPFVNNLVSQEETASVRLFNSNEEIPFLSDILRARQNATYAGAVEMMDCFDVFTVGNDISVANFGDTIQLIGTAFNGTANQAGFWYVSDNAGGNSNRGKFLLPDGTDAPQIFPNVHTGLFTGGSDTILFTRDVTDPLDLTTTDFQVVFQAQNVGTGCIQRDTVEIRIDLRPNLDVEIVSGTDTTELSAGGTDDFSTAYCSGQEIELGIAVERNPTLSGQPVFVLTEVTDTSNQLGLGALDGDTLYLTVNELDLMPTLTNGGDEDIYVKIRMFPYYESDGTSTVPGTSTYTPGDDIIGDSVEFEFIVYNEPIASFGGNDTICYAASAVLDFTGTPNTRVYYRDTLTNTTDSIDLNALGRSEITFPHVTTNLYFQVDSIRRLDPPYCEASAATVAGIAAQPFFVRDSLVAELIGLDTIACDTNEAITFTFLANVPTDIYSFRLTNNKTPGVDSTYLSAGSGSAMGLQFPLSSLNFGGVAGPDSVTFYISELVDTSSTANCSNPAIQDSFKVYVEPEPVISVNLNGVTLTSTGSPSHRDTICITDNLSQTVSQLTMSASQNPMNVIVRDSVFDVNGNTLTLNFISTFISSISNLANNSDAFGNYTGTDSVYISRTFVPYFEMTAGVNSYNSLEECAGDTITFSYLFTPAPLTPSIDFTVDTICGNQQATLNITGGTPGATVGYQFTGTGISMGIETAILGSMGEFTTMSPTIDSGQIFANLQFTFVDCQAPIVGTDSVFVKPLPNGFLTIPNDSVCIADSAYVVFNSNTSFSDKFDISVDVVNLDSPGTPSSITGTFMDGDTIYRNVPAQDMEFALLSVSYANGMGCSNSMGDIDTIWVDTIPTMMVTVSETGVSPPPSTPTATSPDSIFLELCAGDSLYINYDTLMTGSNSEFGDSLFVALFINDPLGVTAAGAGSSVIYRDIDSMGGFDSLHLVNNTNDTARIEIIAVPYFTGVDGNGMPTTPYADACKGDSIELQIDVINNFVSTIGGNYIFCSGTDTFVVITGPDFAEVDYVAISENAMGGLDTSSVRTVTLDNEGRYEIPIDSILQDTTYDLIEARLPAPSGCRANLGPNVTVTVVPPPVATFDSTSLMVCEGAGFTATLKGPINGSARISNNRNSEQTRINFGPDSVGTFVYAALDSNTVFYIDSIYNDTSGLNPVCLTDTITDSLIVIQLDAKEITLLTDTICYGDTAYVTAVNSTMDTFDITVNYNGMNFMLSNVANGDTVAQLNDLTADSTIVTLVSATATTGDMCQVLPLNGNIDSVAVRVDTLPQVAILVTEPVMLTIDTSNTPDTVVICYDEPYTVSADITPGRSIKGFDAALFASIDSNGVNTFSGSATRASFGAMMATPPQASDSIIFNITLQAYYPSDTLPNGDPVPYNPATDCIGDSVNQVLIILPAPTADIVFGMDTICENTTTTVDLMGNVGDTVLMAVEGFGTFNFVLTSPTESYTMPTVEQIDSAVLASTGIPNDDQILFAVVSVNSGTRPSCTSNTLDVDTLFIERLEEVTLQMPDTSICTGSDLLLTFTGTPGTNFLVDFDYANDVLDTTRVLTIGMAGSLDTTITNFRDTLVVTIDSIFSASGRACVNDVNVVSPTIRAIDLPNAELLADTVCNGANLPVVFNYTGPIANASNTFNVEYRVGGLLNTATNVSDGDTIATILGSGVYNVFIVNVTDNATGCDTTYTNTQDGLPFTFIIEDRPQFEMAFTGGVSNGTIFDTEVPQVFPNPGVTFVCSGTNLITDLVSADTTATGDSTMARVIVREDDFGLFSNGSPVSSFPYTIYRDLNDLEFNRLLVNNTTDVEAVKFSWTAFSVTAANDTCYGGTQNFSISVAPTPIATFTNSDTVRICSADTVFLKFMGTNGATIDFSDDDGNSYNGTVSATDSVQYIATQTGPDTVRFGLDLITYITPGVNIPCTSTAMDSVVLIIFERPDPYLTFATNDTICYGETVDVIFNDSIGLGNWDVVVNGTTFNNVSDGQVLFTSAPLTGDRGYTISAATDGNGCTADTISQGVVFTDTVRIEELPLLSSEVELFGLFGPAISTDMLVDGLLELDTFCAQQRYTVNSSTTTASNLAGDPLYVRIEISGDVALFYPTYTTGDTTFFVPVNMVDDVLNSGLLANNSDTLIDVQVILTPYFETNVAMPALDGAECGGAQDTLQIAVDPLPTPTGNLFTDVVCSGDTFSFQFDTTTVIGNYQEGTRFDYTVSATAGLSAPASGTTMGTISEVLNNTGLNAGVITYSVTPYGPRGCQGANFSIEVTVNPEPSLNAVAQFVCSRAGSDMMVSQSILSVAPDRYIIADLSYDSDSLTAIDTVVVGDTITLINHPTNDGLFIRDTFQNVSTGAQVVTYSLVPMVSATGCTGDTVDYSLTVNPEPLVSDLDTIVCTDVRLNIDLQETVQNDIGSNFTWRAVSGDFALVEGATTTAQTTGFISDSLRLITSSGTQVRQITYQVDVIGNNGCPADSNTYMYTVFVSPNIVLTTTTPGDDFICTGDPDGINVTAVASNTIGDVNYNWSIGATDPDVVNPTIINPSGNGSSVAVNASGTGQFTLNLEVDDEGGCTAMASTVITVYGDMVPDFDTTYVGLSPSATVNFTDETAGFPTDWLWTFDDPASGSSDTSRVQNPTHTFSGPGRYNVTLQVIRQAFCPDTATVTKEVFIGFVPVPKTDTIILYPGFNVISIDVDTVNNGVADIFDEIINFEVTPGNSNLNQVIGIHPDQSSSPLIYTQFFQTLSTIRPGFGYAVNVDVQDTLIVSGTTIDVNTRVDLQAGMNIVGYLPQNPETVVSYFDSIISDNNLSLIQTYENGGLKFWTPFISTFNDVQNGLGYILDISAAYTGSQWRDDNYTSSHFEYLYGTTSFGNAAANHQVEVIDENGTVLTSFNLDDEGKFGPAFLFGIVQDVNAHEVRGIPDGTSLRFRIGDQVSTTSHVFNGGWMGTELDIEFEGTVSSLDEAVFETIRFNIFPNPAQQVANLRFVSTENIANLRVETISATGQLVDVQTLENVRGEQNIELNVRELPAGVYLVRLSADGNYLGNEQLIIRR